MNKIVNPKCAVLIKGTTDIWTEDFDKRVDIDIDITKDFDDEPNEAIVTIHNLNDNTISQILDPSVKNSPVEIFFAPFGSDDLVKCYTGEISNATTQMDSPGESAIITCKSNSFVYRSNYVDKKTYAAGTSYTTIINDFVADIGLPNHIENVTGSVVLAESFTGPAFELLNRFIRDLGMFCHITDGVLYVTGVYEPVDPQIVNITEAMQESTPRPTERVDIGDVMMKTILDTRGTGKSKNKSIGSSSGLTQKDKKRLFKKKTKNKNDDYVEYEAVDTVLIGVECKTLGVPSINPDNIVTFEGDDNQYRVHTVRHYGSNDGEGFTTMIEADIMDGIVGGGGNFEFDTKTASELKELYQ